jgi:hypothetical protein
MAKKTTAVAKVEDDQLPAALLEEMEADSGDGLQNVTTADMAIPFLRILQQMSPQLNKREGAYVEGAEEGMVFNTVTGEVWGADTGLIFIPCAFNFRHIQWKDRKDGGGIVNSYPRGVELPAYETDDRNKMRTAEGHILAPTAEHYGIIYDPASGYAEQAVIAMSSTQLKCSRKWNSLMSQQILKTKQGNRTAPSYSRMYRLKTVGESNDDGNWSNWNVTLEGVVQDADVYRMARQFAKSVNSGEVQAKHTAPADEEQTSTVM